MRHFVQYHNPDKMGPYPPSKEDSNKDCWIVTNKRGVKPGDTVWLIAGQGRPRSYSLCEKFVVDRLDPQPRGEYKFRVSGTNGSRFGPCREIDANSDWFKKLLRVTRRFNYGLQRINHNDVIQGLEDLCI